LIRLFKKADVMPGLKSTKLSDPPYLQVALDTTDLGTALKIASRLPKNQRLILEAGTPLIKAEGVKVANDLKKYSSSTFVVADMRTHGSPEIEANIAFRGGADAATVSGCARKNVIEQFVTECRGLGIYSILDCADCGRPIELLSTLKALPDIVNLHISENGSKQLFWAGVLLIKKKYPGIIVSACGGINRDTAEEAIRWGTDIVVVGRYITDSEDVEGSAKAILKLMEK
jgi:bifunctional enzyme Fae/Hps